MTPLVGALLTVAAGAAVVDWIAVGLSSGWLNVTTSPVIPRPVGPTTAG